MQFKRRLKKEASIDMAPLVDAVFILLLFFVVTSTFKETPGLEIDLPETREAQGVELRDLVVNIAPKDGGSVIYLGETPVTLESLPAELEKELKRRPEDKQFVVVQADKSVAFEQVYRVFDIARQAGAKGITVPGTFKPEERQ